MEFDLVELLKYLNLDGLSAIIVLSIIVVLYLTFSSSKVAEKVRIRVVKVFSDASTILHSEKEKIAEETAKEIDNVLEKLQFDTGATNVLFCNFHNGKYDSIGNSIIKFSAVNEKTKPGHLQIGDNIQNCSRSLYGKFCDALIKKRFVRVMDKNLIPNEETELVGLLNRFGEVQEFYAHSTITLKGQTSGFIVLIYRDKSNKSETELQNLLHIACARIGELDSFRERMSDTIR